MRIDNLSIYFQTLCLAKHSIFSYRDELYDGGQRQADDDDRGEGTAMPSG